MEKEPIKSIYPLRPSEFVSQLDTLANVEPLVLSESEKKELSDFEQPLFDETQRLKKISISEHTIYPDYFTTQEGSSLFTEIYLGREIKEGEKISRDEVIRVFFNTDLTSIPLESRKKGNYYSSQWAKRQFSQDFRGAAGEVEEISNPERIVKVVNVEKLIESIQGLKDLKDKIKRISEEITDKSDFDEAKKRVISFYQRYINVLIIDKYTYSRILANQPQRNESEEKALVLLKGRFTSDQASRTMERIDHFLMGTGLRIGENGLFETLPENLSRYLEEKNKEPPVVETQAYQEYNNYKVNAQQAALLGQVILEKCGFNQGDGKVWKTIVLDRKETLAVHKGKKEVRIPTSFNRGLIDTLTVLAHEIEGHVLRGVNQENSKGVSLQLTELDGNERSGILEEAASMSIEDDTKQIIVGMKRDAEPYYYLTLLKKREGGTFKECFQTFFENYARRKFNLSLDQAIQDENKYQEIFDYVYDRTLRIFRENTPLDDSSGFLPTSKQFKYAEQELIIDVLKNNGLSKLLYIAGIDLYSLGDYKRLNLLNLEKVEEPRMIVAKEIWPQIKKALDKNKSLDKTLDNLT